MLEPVRRGDRAGTAGSLFDRRSGGGDREQEAYCENRDEKLAPSGEHASKIGLQAGAKTLERVIFGSAAAVRER